MVVIYLVISSKFLEFSAHVLVDFSFGVIFTYACRGLLWSYLYYMFLNSSCVVISTNVC